MDNISIKIDLLKLNGARVVKAGGVTGLFIPSEVNKELYIGQKGAYLNLTAIQLRNPSPYGDTHLVKGNIPRDVFDRMSEEQRKALPILGNARPLVKQESSAPAIQPQVEELEDLPF